LDVHIWEAEEVRVLDRRYIYQIDPKHRDAPEVIWPILFVDSFDFPVLTPPRKNVSGFDLHIAAYINRRFVGLIILVVAVYDLFAWVARDPSGECSRIERTLEMRCEK
jgi:hypothetical protein